MQPVARTHARSNARTHTSTHSHTHTSGAPPAPRWTQWIFLQLLKRGLAYQAEVPVNWCPALGTVLANEEVGGWMGRGAGACAGARERVR